MKYVQMLFAAVAALFVSFSATASYLDAGASTVVTTVQTDAATVFGYGWLLLGVIFGGLLVMKLFKKVVSKGT